MSLIVLLLILIIRSPFLKPAIDAQPAASTLSTTRPGSSLFNLRLIRSEKESSFTVNSKVSSSKSGNSFAGVGLFEVQCLY